MSILVDSDILIEVSRGKNGEIAARWAELAQSEDLVFYSPVSIAELWAGARPDDHEMLTRLFDVLRCVAIDAEIGRRAGDYLRQFNKSHGLEIADALIAAGAASRGAALWTHNRKHYPMRDLSFF